MVLIYFSVCTSLLVPVCDVCDQSISKTKKHSQKAQTTQVDASGTKVLRLDTSRSIIVKEIYSI